MCQVSTESVAVLGLLAQRRQHFGRSLVSRYFSFSSQRQDVCAEEVSQSLVIGRSAN